MSPAEYPFSGFHSALLVRSRDYPSECLPLVVFPIVSVVSLRTIDKKGRSAAVVPGGGRWGVEMG